MKFEKSLCLAALRLPTWKKGVWGWECTGCEHSVLSDEALGREGQVISPVNGNYLVTTITQERLCRLPIRELPRDLNLFSSLPPPSVSHCLDTDMLNTTFSLLFPLASLLLNQAHIYQSITRDRCLQRSPQDFTC